MFSLNYIYLPIFTEYNKKVTKVSDIAEQKGLSTGSKNWNVGRVRTDDAVNLPSSFYRFCHGSTTINPTDGCPFPVPTNSAHVNFSLHLIAILSIVERHALSLYALPLFSDAGSLWIPFDSFLFHNILPPSSISALFLPRPSMAPKALAVCRSFATCYRFRQSGKVGKTLCLIEVVLS